MIIKNLPLEKIEYVTIQSMLEEYPQYLNIDLEKGYTHKTAITSRKPVPRIKLATEEDAKAITEIFKDVYKGTYPYKMMEDEEELKMMILSPNFHWITFKLENDELVGCSGFHVDFEKKQGSYFGFAFKRKYQGSMDIMTATMICMISILNKFKKDILLWYAEVRTAHTNIQHIGKMLGLRPIAFLPNKDIFFNKNESEFLFILYDKNMMSRYRFPQKPSIIKEVIYCYFHASKTYSLDNPNIENFPQLFIDLNTAQYYESHVQKRVDTDVYGNELISFSIKGTSAYMKFIHYPNIQIIEKTYFRISNLEELFVFVKKIKDLIRELKIRYFEVYLSAYEPAHQTIFKNEGFFPTGYIPSWEYNDSSNLFEDRIVFVYHEKQLINNMKLIGETRKYLKNIKQYKLVVKEE